jgi:paraquat-inducible protein A
VVKKTLRHVYPGNYDIPVLIFISLVFLILGLFLPVITLKELVFWKHTFSVLTGIVSLVTENHYFLAVIIFVFSVIFPIFKLTMLMSIWFRKMTDDERIVYVQWLSGLGKWSILDVFVVAITIVIAKVSGFASAKPEIGIYFFGSSVLLGMFVMTRIEKLVQKP